MVLVWMPIGVSNARLPEDVPKVQLKYYDDNFTPQLIEIGPEQIPKDIDQNILNLHGKVYSFSGPNCFATALYSVGLKDNLVGVDGPEFQSTLDLFCRPVDQPRPGDIGVIATSVGDIIMHAFVHISDTLAFEKQNPDGGTKGTALRFISKNHVLNRVLPSKECMQAGGSLTECSNKLLNFRCDLGAHPFASHPLQLLDVYQSISEAQDLLSQILELQETQESTLSIYLNPVQMSLAHLSSLLPRKSQELQNDRGVISEQDQQWLQFYKNQLASLKLQFRFIELGLKPNSF